MFKFIFSFFILFFTGCATYQTKVSASRDFLAQRNCPEALKNLEALAAKDDGDQLVYLMDYGSALQICGEYKKSNQILLQAEKLSEEKDYHSVSRLTGATFINEEMIQYKGDTFEKLFLNVVLALNFIQMNDLDSAQVEVRKMNQKFVKLNFENKKNFELNSFSKYLSGLIWELNRKYDDACIDFKDAYFIDTSYRLVAQDMLRTCWKAGRTDEFNTLAKKISASPEEIKQAKEKNKTELILLFMQGWGPRKSPRPTDRISAYLQPVYSRTKTAQLEINSEIYKSQPVYSVEKAAIQTLEDDYGSLVARRIGSRVVKEVLADQVRQKDAALGAVAWLAMVASERADLRQWSILPQTFQILRIPIKSGEHKLQINGLDDSMSVSEVIADLNFKVGSGEKKFQVIRSLK